VLLNAGDGAVRPFSYAVVLSFTFKQNISELFAAVSTSGPAV